MAGKIQRYRDAIAKYFANEHEPRRMRDILSWLEREYPNNDFSLNMFRSQVHKACANVESAYKSKAPKILFYSAPGHTYRKATMQEVENGKSAFGTSGAASEDDSNDEESGSEFEGEKRFALEDDLKRYLARNLPALEKGLTFWDETSRMEFGIQNRRIDILGKDVDGVPVIVELKVSKGHEQVIGQVLHYRALLKRLLNVTRVRIMLVASEISPELRSACSEITDVTLWEYELAMKLKPVIQGE